MVKTSPFDREKQAFDFSKGNKISDYKGTTPEKVKLLNETFEVKNWRDLLVKTAEKLLEINPDSFNKLSYSQVYRGFRLSKDDSLLREPRQLSNGLFLETHFSANSIVRIIKKLIKGCGHKETDIEIHLKN